MAASRLGIGLALLGLAACGNGAEEGGPLLGRYVGQEIWVTYRSPEHDGMGRRTGRSRAEAREIAEGLHRRVLAGEDLGALAREHSNAPGGGAHGFSGFLPRDANAPDARDRALAAVPVGGVTGIVEWLGGFWFARRTTLDRGRELEREFHRLQRLRVRFRAIAILYRGAEIQDIEAAERVRLTKDEAVALAEDLLRQLQAGADFAALARAHSNDASGEAGGVVSIFEPDGGKTQWIPWGTAQVPYSVLEAAFDTPPGVIHPKVVVSPRGVFLLKVEAVREEGQ